MIKRTLTLATITMNLVAVSALADTLTVIPDGSGDYTTIGGALAVAVAGDVVLVHAGLYAERDLEGPPMVSIRSVDGAGATIVDAGGQGFGFVAWQYNGLWNSKDSRSSTRWMAASRFRRAESRRSASALLRFAARGYSVATSRASSRTSPWFSMTPPCTRGVGSR